jgi:hypothetical protein
MILEKFWKKKHRIWIIYDGEILVTKFNSRLKEEIPTIIVFFILSQWCGTTWLVQKAASDPSAIDIQEMKKAPVMS